MALDRNKVARAAEKLVARGRLDAAIDEYRKVLAENASDTTTLNRVGDLYARLNRLDKATALFKKTADHFIDEGFFVKAIAIYKKIIRLDPAQIEVYERLADLYSRQGLLNESRSQYQVVADYYQKHGNVDAAIGVYGKLIELEPGNPSHRLRLADQLRQSHRPREAVVQFLEIAALFLGHGRADDAVKLYSAALDVDASDLEFVGEALQRLQEAGHHSAAESLLSAAAERNPEAQELAGLLELGESSPAPEAAADRDVAASSGPKAAPTEIEGEDILVLDLDDEDLSADLGPPRGELLSPGGQVGEAEVEAEVEVEAEAEIEIDLAGLRPGAGEGPVPTAADLDERLAELLVEAETLAKFGLVDKAVARLEEALEIDPEHAATYDPLLGLYLDRGEADRVVDLGSRLAGMAREGRATAAWELVRGRLQEEGYAVEGDRIGPPAAAQAPPPAEPVPAPPDEAAPRSEAGEWLREDAAKEEVDDLFRAEEEFFDLASELEDELRREGALAADEELLEPADEQSVEEIVEGFKQGMAETLSAEDYDTHYNLGIAYREMGLVDEAIGEFQLAAKDPRYLVDCCSLLAASFVDKGFPELAVKWYLRGLDSPSLTEEESLGLLYELGNLHLALDERERARQRFVEIYGINSNYRDIVAKLRELDPTGLP
jgi:tetratricopeptide (TPR) repeat protein